MPAKDELVIAAVGDVMMPASIQAAAARGKGGYDFLFEKVAQDLRSADITFANLETPVDHMADVSGYPKFNARPSLLSALKKAGVAIVSIANNHTMDMGTGGLKRTLDNIEAAGLLFTGAGRTKAETAEIKHLKVRDVDVAFIAYTYSTNRRLPPRAAGAPGVNILRAGSEADLRRAADKVRQARAAADLVVVSLHWGDEYATSPSPWQRKVSSELVEAGADVILGHHPHVLQPIDCLMASDGRTGLVVFSLGNFVSSQNAGVTYENRDHKKALRGDGIILTITAVKENGKTRIVSGEFVPIWSLRSWTGRGHTYRPVSLPRELSSLTAKADRSTSEDRLLRLLSYRQEYIIRELTGKPR